MMAVVIYPVNLIISLINPKWNIYAYLHYGYCLQLFVLGLSYSKMIVFALNCRTFQTLRDFDLSPFWRKIGRIWHKSGRICHKIGRICRCKCGSAEVDDPEEAKKDKSKEEDANKSTEGNGAGAEKKKAVYCKPSNYFLKMTRGEVLKWHLGGLLSIFRCRGVTKDYQLIHHRYMFWFILICIQDFEVQ